MKNILSRFGKLFLQSFRTVKADKVLLKLPQAAGVAVLLCILLAGAGIAAVTLLQRPDIYDGFNEDTVAQMMTIVSVKTFAVYFITYFLFMAVVYFCCVAFVSQLYQSVLRQPTGIRRGIAFAAGRFHVILFWALTITVINVALKMIQDHSNFLINIPVDILGMGWLFTCYFDIAGITADRTVSNPLRVVRRSLSTLRTAWGEALLGLISFYLLTVSAVFIGVILCAIIFFIGMAVKILLWPALILAGAGLLATLCLLFFITGWDQAYQGLLYLSARGQLPGEETLPANEPQTALQTE